MNVKTAYCFHRLAYLGLKFSPKINIICDLEQRECKIFGMLVLIFSIFSTETEYIRRCSEMFILIFSFFIPTGV